MELKPISEYDFELIRKCGRHGEIIDTIRNFAESDMQCSEITDWEKSSRNFDTFVKTVRSIVSRVKLPIKVAKRNDRLFLIKK